MAGNLECLRSDPDKWVDFSGHGGARKHLAQSKLTWFRQERNLRIRR